MLPHLKDLTVSEYHLVVLDTQHGVSRRILLKTGPSCCANVNRRTVFQRAIRELPAALALVHNHPDGDPWPSDADCAQADTLATAGRQLDIPIHDYVIIGHCDEYVSFRDEDWL